jgi:amino acid permease
VKQFETKDKVTEAIVVKDFDMEKFIDAINITLTSYGFIINLFPVASQMKEQTDKNVKSAVAIALAFCFTSYLILSYLA